MLYKILEYPHEGLNKKANLVTSFDDQLIKTINNLYETMYNAGGIGLAATQVDIHQQIFVMDLSEKHNKPECLINPKIIQHSGKIKETEGCLSFPGLLIEVPRFESVSVHALNQYGESSTRWAHDLQARCIQHEMDHLQGITFISRLSGLKRRRAIKSFSLLKKQQEPNEHTKN